ncbi:Flavin-linked sulfhydryl oxidase of the mitochondrial IMS [Blastocladiella emersonii ATCC 22665]|nr:Flavin-linked sulfhydryl oxidase of the mitochondrial IMS [Blastocladiella emersonii ATCC 22665]
MKGALPLGPDGKPCGVCTDFKSWTREKKAGNSTSQQPDSSSSSSSSSAPGTAAPASTSSTAAAAAWGDYEPETPCPPDSIELGRHSWTFLHTTAAYFPETPTPAQQAAATSLIASVASLYPCGWCADHLREYVAQKPPKTESRAALSEWMCVMHNDVNLRLGKPEFDCSRVMERWRESLDRARCGGWSS